MPKKVLIIEDSPVDAQIAQDVLQKEGLDVDIAHNGEDGIAKALKTKPDLVILDIMLPDISGFDVCKRLKSEISLNNSIVVMLSIKDNVDDISRAFHMGADDYIIKPSEPTFLAKKVKLYLGLR